MNTTMTIVPGWGKACLRPTHDGSPTLELKRAKQILIGLVLAVTAWLPCRTLAAVLLPVDLGSAATFAVLAGPAFTSTSGGTINGDVGVSPGNSVTLGAIPVIVNGVVHAADAVALQGQTDLTTAYNDAASRPLSALVSGELGGLTLPPGVYKDNGAPASLGLTGTLTLDAMGDPEAVWIFQSASTLIAEVGSRVVLINGATACHVFWQVGSSATLRTGASFKGTIMAMEAITLENSATLDGQALARTAAVTLDNNTINLADCSNAKLTLTIISEHGTGTPPAGLPPTGVVYTNDYGATLTNGITAIETNGGTQYVNVGWTMTGNEPVSGSVNTMVMVLTNDAVLTWLWSTNYLLNASTVGNGAVGGSTNGFYIAGSTVVITAVPSLGYQFSGWSGTVEGATNNAVLTLTMEEAKTVIATFVPSFIDVSALVTWSVDWACEPCKRYYLGTLTIANINSPKAIMPPIWFEVQHTAGNWLRAPTGTDTNGMEYLDISTAVANKLLATGNGDLALDPGESVTVTGIGLMGSGTPISLLMALWADPPDAHATSTLIGVPFEMSLPDAFTGATNVTVKNLPKGLNYDAATGKITGLPTKSGAFTVAISATGIPTQTVMVGIGALPIWATGVFNGYIEGGGLVLMTVSSQGKSTGKLTLGGTNYTFSAASFAAGGNAEQGLSLNAVAKSGRSSLQVTLRIAQAIAPAPSALGVAVGLADGTPLVLYRDVWKTADAVLAPYIGYYTATLPGNETYGSGYLTFTVNKTGKVVVAGKLADGKAVSMSGTLILDEAGSVWAVVYTTPSTSYRGDTLFGIAEFVAPSDGAVFLQPLDGGSFLWRNNEPKATSVYGEGFDRELTLSGGWFDKIGNLYDYYRNMALSVGTDTNAPMPELRVGNSSYQAAEWDPDGIALTITSNKLGVLTGIAAPDTGSPVKVGGAWDYGAENSVGLKIRLVRATGVFNGTFKAWFDSAATPTSRTIALTGVLTPERKDQTDGIAGRGFFLWPGQALKATTPYSFNWSYDLKILLAEPSP